MAHYPLNHHLRRPYRVAAGLAGLYLLVTGAIGVARSWGNSFFGRGHDWSLGLRVNPAGAWLLTLIGLVVLAGALLGGGVHHQVATVLGWGMCGLAMVLMATMQTDANVVSASMINVIVLTVLGLIVLTSGLYGRVGTRAAAEAEEAAAHPR